MAYSYSGAKSTNEASVKSNNQDLTIEQQIIAIEMLEKQKEEEQRNQNQANTDAAGDVIGSTADVLFHTPFKSVNTNPATEPVAVGESNFSPTANDVNATEVIQQGTESWSGITDTSKIDSFSGIPETGSVESAAVEETQGFVDGTLEIAGDVAGGAVDMATSVIKGVGDVASGAVDIAGNVASGAVDIAGNVVSGAADAAGSVLSGIGSIFDGL